MSIKKQFKHKLCVNSGKRCIRSKRIAEQRKDKIKRERGATIIKNVYKCSHCSEWHLTKMEIKEHKIHIFKMRQSRKPTGNIKVDIENRLEFLTQKKK